MTLEEVFSSMGTKRNIGTIPFLVQNTVSYSLRASIPKKISIFLMHIAIPSYNRATMCREKTIATLEKYKITNATVYVVKEQEDEYRKVLPDWVQIVVGVKGLIAQRRFIEHSLPLDSDLVFMDDDLDDIDLSLSSYTTLTDFLEDAFRQSRNRGAFLWGVYAVYNPFFRKARTEISTCLNFCVGCFYGIITRRKVDITLCHHGNKEDVERSIRYFIEDGIVLRFNKIAPKTKYYNVGGLGTKKERLESVSVEAHKLQEAFPQYGKVKVRKNGLTEFTLKKCAGVGFEPTTFGL